MLEYVKTILVKVSFDRKLLKKEYKKSFRWLNQDELNELRGWLRGKQFNQSRS